MAYTLNDLDKVATTKFGAGIVKGLLRQSDLMKIVPFDDWSALKAKFSRWQTLPTVATRKIGGSYTASNGTTENMEETLFAFGGEITIDRLLMLDKSVQEDPMVTQVKMLTASLAFKWNDGFINGDHATDPDFFEGLKKRVAQMPARMRVRASLTTDSLKVLADVASHQLFFDAVDRAIAYTGANTLLMNENVKIGFSQLLRRLGIYTMTTDQYGNMWDMYGKCKLVDVGLKSDQTTEIITETETAEDSGADGSSIYAVRFDGEDGLHALKLSGTSFDPYDINGGQEFPTAPVKGKRVDVAVGLKTVGKYAVARVHNFKMAAS